MNEIPLIREPADLAGLIDHTLLKPDATAAQVRRLCAEARQYHFHSVCVNPIFVALVAPRTGGLGGDDLFGDRLPVRRHDDSWRRRRRPGRRWPTAPARSTW